MKNKLFTVFAIALATFSITSAPISPEARTVDFAKNRGGQPIIDKRGNCVRSQWLADQCCDPCGFPDPAPAAPVKKVVETEKMITSIDLVRQSIYFNIDKDNIDSDDMFRMNQVINEVRNSSGIKSVKLVGYADRFASRKYNVGLSKRRAANALNYFRSNGFFNNVNVGFGFFGEEKPVTNCPTNIGVQQQIDCLQADRRVDIEVELLRNKMVKTSEMIEVPATDVRAVPGAAKPGTYGVEVYSRPVDPKTINFNQQGMVQEAPNAIPGISYQQVQGVAVPTNDVESETIYEESAPQSIDALGRRY